MTTSAWVAQDYEVQYWNGSAWVTVPNGSVTGNNKVWRKFEFSPITTSKIRVRVTNGGNYVMFTEIEAWSPSSTGGTGWLKYEYDEAGRIKVIKTDSGTALETNTYGTSRQRLKKEGSGTRTYYAWGGSSVLAEYAETGSQSNMPWSKHYVYAGSRLLSTAAKNGSSEKLE